MRTPSHPDHSLRRVIIVSGLPRSGTSMLMAMLEAGGVPLLTDGRRGPDADNPRGYFEFEPVRRLLAGDVSWVPAAAGHAVKVVVPLVRALPQDLPCDVLLLDRALDEVLASQSAMLARLGRDPASSDLLRPAFEREWAMARHHLESHPETRLLVLDHARVVGDPPAAAIAIAAFLERRLDLTAMAAVVDPALHRQRGGREADPNRPFPRHPA